MNHYEVLGIEYPSDFQRIKKAYYKRVKECHPDLFGNSPGKEEEFKCLASAFDILSDTDKKSLYDQSMGFSSAAAEPVEFSTVYGGDVESVMDTPADDTLEELLVGNNPPPNTTIATVLKDLERTMIFLTFREGKDLFARRNYKLSLRLFERAVAMSPNNILYRYYLGRNYVVLKNFSQAKVHFRAAIKIGSRRIPPQRLERIHSELDDACRKHLPWWYAVMYFFRPERPKLYIPADEEMIRETNRAMARLAKNNRKRLN